MRRTCSPAVIVALSFAALLAGCEADAPPPAPTTETSAKPEPAKAVRPPFPNMATAAWGSTVIEERVKTADASGALSSHLASALQALHALDEGAPAALQKSAASVYATGEVEGDRALGAALLAAGLVLDTSAHGYKERLTDAHGLAAYAGTLDGGTAVAQAARALVAIRAGRVYEGEKLVDVMSVSSRLDPDSALLLALARFTLGQRNDEVLKQGRVAVEGKPESMRARSLVARTYLDLGLVDEALQVLDEGRAALGDAALPPALDALRGRALLARGALDEGARVLDGVLAKLPESARGEALYHLAAASLDAGDVEKGDALRGQISTLSGFEHEAALLTARVSLARGSAAEAKQQAIEVCRTRGLSFNVALDCVWVATEACAAAGDVKCVDEWGRKAVGSDDDFARLNRARATLASAAAKPAEGSAGPGDEALAPQQEAHLLSPFDAAVAKRVGLPAAKGGADAARIVRAARRAIAFKAENAAEAALTRLIDAQPTCRVCRALLARVPANPDEAARRAAAAVDGKGPPLAERDLLEVIDVLGGSGTAEAKAAVEKLANDPRARVKEAVATAKKEQQNPEARAARKAKEAEEAAERPGTVPAPGSTTHGHHE